MRSTKSAAMPPKMPRTPLMARRAAVPKGGDEDAEDQGISSRSGGCDEAAPDEGNSAREGSGKGLARTHLGARSTADGEVEHRRRCGEEGERRRGKPERKEPWPSPMRCSALQHEQGATC